jgi:hypothetical protein
MLTAGRNATTWLDLAKDGRVPGNLDNKTKNKSVRDAKMRGFKDAGVVEHGGQRLTLGHGWIRGI